MKKYLIIILIVTFFNCDKIFSQSKNDYITFSDYKYFLFWVRDSILRTELGIHFEDYWLDITAKKFIINWKCKINLADDEVYYFLKDSNILINDNNECFFNSNKLRFKENFADTNEINIFPNIPAIHESKLSKNLGFDNDWNFALDTVQLINLDPKQKDAYKRWSLKIEQRKKELKNSKIRNCKIK